MSGTVPVLIPVSSSMCVIMKCSSSTFAIWLTIVFLTWFVSRRMEVAEMWRRNHSEINAAVTGLFIMRLRWTSGG